MGKHFLSPYRTGHFTSFQRIVRVVKVTDKLVHYKYVNNNRVADVQMSHVIAFKRDFEALPSYDSPLYKVLND